MAKKKTILIETSNQGRVWSVKITCADTILKSALSHFIRDQANSSGMIILNASDPFGDTKPKRVRKARPESVAA